MPVLSILSLTKFCSLISLKSCSISALSIKYRLLVLDFNFCNPTILKSSFKVSAKMNLNLPNLPVINSNNSNAPCTFCEIIQNKDPKIMYEDDDVVVFPDIKPATPHHYLVVPKQHLLNAKVIGPEHKPLVQKMIEVARQILEENGCDMADTSYGFHWPPFNTVAHLHLHAIAPKSEMAFASRMIFRPDSWWFVSPEYVLSRL